MQVITTKKLNPTNTKGARVKAAAAAGSVTVSYEHGMNLEKNHRAAALKLCEKLGWNYVMVSGQDKNGDGQHTLLHANMAQAGTAFTKYRAGQIETVRQGMMKGDTVGTLRVTDGAGGNTRHLRCSANEAAALLDLFNQIDDE